MWKSLERFVINGPCCLNGEVNISGAKNAALPLMAAALLTQEKINLYNFPTNILDVKVKADFLEKIGVYVEYDHNKESIEIQADNIFYKKLEHYDYPIRTTYLLAAGQLFQNGIAYIPYPGGCDIGHRKYDLHVMIWEKIGCKVKENR